MGTVDGRFVRHIVFQDPQPFTLKEKKKSLKKLQLLKTLKKTLPSTFISSFN